MSVRIKSLLEKYASSEEEAAKIRKLCSFENYVYKLPPLANLSEQIHLFSMYPEEKILDKEKAKFVDSIDGNFNLCLMDEPEQAALKEYRDLSLKIEGGKEVLQLLKKQQAMIADIINHFEDSIAKKERELEKKQTEQLLWNLVYSNTIFSNEKTGKYPVYDSNQPVRYFYIIHEDYLNAENPYFKFGVTNDLNEVSEEEEQHSFRKTWTIYRSVSDTSEKTLEKCQKAFQSQHVKNDWYKLELPQLRELYTLLNGKTLEESIRSLTEEQNEACEERIAKNQEWLEKQK